jgi:hypothetical protein
MALIGMPSGSNGGAIPPRIEYDSKAGRWHRVERSQNAANEWVTEKFEMEKGDVFVMDMATIEVGWIAFASTGPDFQMVPNGQSVGPKPSDAHKFGFRVKVLLPKEETPRTFASTAKAVLGVIDELHTKAESGPVGQVPVVKIAGTRMVETKGPQGVTRNYAPLVEIVKYVPRPAALGDAPSMGVTMAPSSPAPKAQFASVFEPERVLAEDRVDAARAAVALSIMSEKEADRFGI